MRKTLLREPQSLRLGTLAPGKRLARLLGVGALLLGSFGAQAQLSGAKAIPGSGSTGYATLTAAIADLNVQGVGPGGVTFNLAAGYTETFASPTAGSITATGTAANPIIFQKAGTGANPTITAAVGNSPTLDAIIGLQAADYVTFDGLTLVDPASNGTVNTQMEWGFALLKTTSPAVDGCQSVTIRNCTITLQKGTVTSGIYSNSHTATGLTQVVPTTAAGTHSNNKFYGNTISGVNNGIYVAGYAASSPYTFYDQNNEVGSIVSGTTATGNSITNYGTTTTAYGIYAIYQNGLKVQGNTVDSAPTGAAAGPTSTLYGILVSTGGNADLLGNIVRVTTNATTSTTYGIQNGSGGNATGGTVNIANNNLTMTSATSTSASFYGLYNTASVANLNISGNTLDNWSRTAATSGSNYMLYVSTGATATQNVFNNTISNFTTTGASSTVYCFYATNNSAAAVQYYGNTVQNVSSDGNGLYGMYLTSGSTLDVYRNRVSGLTANGTTATIYGIYTTGTTTNVTNNVIGDFSTPNASSATAISGLYLNGGTTVNAQYNSIYLNASTAGTNFGTSGIYYSATSTTLVTLRNNVVVNTSTAAGTGSTVALRRTSGTAGTVPVNLTSATNNNLYYAGTPGSANLIYGEGTTTISNGQQTLADYKNFVAGRESNSVTESPSFLSTSGINANFLKVSTTTPTQIESGGAPISGITTDFANLTRSTTAPDLGAFEGTYQPLDLTGPLITGATLTNTSSTTNRTVVVSISDPSGVATGTNGPRLYYRKGTTGAFVFVNATSVSGSSYTFTLNYALLPGGSVAAGDVIQYYVAAQDLATTGNVSTSPGGGSGITPPGTTAPATLASFQIVGNMSGIYYVGTSTPPAGTPTNRVFATLTAAASAYSVNTLVGATTFYLLDASYSTAETFPIVFTNNPTASATNTLLVSPAPGVSSVVTGTSGAPAVVLLTAARYITLDGANTTGGTTRNLTLTSTNTGANAVVWVGSQGAGAGSTNITVRNLNVVGGSMSNTASFGIYASAAPSVASSVPSASTYGDDNDNLVVQNNAVTTVYEAIYAKANSVATSYDGLQIVGNRIGAAPTGAAVPADNVMFRGIDLQGATAPLVSRNTILGMDGTASTINIAGIELNANVTDAVVSRNAISGLRQLNTSGYGAYGINLGSTTNVTNTEISNNVISDVLIAAYSSSTTWNAFGIRLTGGTGTKIYYNSVNMFGTIVPTTSNASPSNISAGLIVTSTLATGLDVRNNIFVNSITSSAATNTVKSYSVYYTAASVLSTSNYNDYYVSGPRGVLAYVGADVATLAALQTATGKDGNSISTDPIFTTPANLLPISPAVANTGTPLAAVTVDFTGATRSATTPSLGAYQFTPLSVDVAPSALVSPVSSATSTCFGANTPVTVQVRNLGSAALNFATNPLAVRVVISGPNSSTQTLNQTISTGTLASTATQDITLTSLADFTALGTYSFAITATVTGDANTANDLLAPAPTLNVVAPVGGTLSPASYALCVSGTASLSLAGAANGSIQLQSSSSATGPFTDVAGATSATYTTPVLTSTTYYRVKVSCGTNEAYSTVAAITVNNPVVSAAPSPLSVCAGGTASLTATVPTGISVRYFTAATGGTPVGTGNPYVTPALTASTTYYAEAFAGGTERVGRTAPNQTDGGYSGTNTGLVFTATGPTVIQAATVYNATATAGTVTVELRDNTSGALVATTAALAVPAGSTSTLIPTVLQLNLAVPAAGTYRLVTATAGTPPTLYRDFTGPVYPYTSPSGVVSITGGYIGGTSTTYYFFYNVVVGNECIGASRTPIQVNVTPGLVATLASNTAALCGRTPYALAGAIAGTATGGTYTSSGTGVFTPNATTLNATYTPSAADVAAGTVTLTLTPTGPAAACTQTAQAVLSITTPPNSSFSYPAGVYCTNSPVTVAPVLAPGAVAGTFSASGFGLRIDPVTGVITLTNTNIDGAFTITNTVTGTGACSTGASSTTTFNVIFGIGQPTLTATPQAGGVLLSTQALAGVTYQFYRNVNGTPVAVGASTATGSLLLPAGSPSGAYTVVATSTQGCSSVPSTAVTVTVPTSTQTATLNGVSLRVFPNPTADGQLSIELSGINAKASQLTVLNALGQVVHTGTVAAGTAQLKLSQLASGVYTFRVLTEQGVLTQRVVRQ